MAKFMNAELQAIRDNLRCGHCSSCFKGSDSQAWKVKYDKSTVYCSSICRTAAMRKKFSTPVPNRGPCKTCGIPFSSRTAKIYCCLDCYVKSDQFKDMQSNYWAPSQEVKDKISATLKKGSDTPCIECGTVFYQQRASKSRPIKKFCGTGCYRSYMAKRFDRWIANPQTFALPQCYDEFLDKHELTCIVPGCEWHGQWLTMHMNQAHGVPSDEFKRAAGFNLGTGVIARPLAEAMRQREKTGVAILDEAHAVLSSGRQLGPAPLRYRSLEGREHSKKSRSLYTNGPSRVCQGCDKVFVQSTPFGKSLYCSVGCRSLHYKNKTASNAKQRIRLPDGTFKWIKK